MKKFVCVIGVGLVVGAIATAMYMLLSDKKKRDVCGDCKNSENQETPAKNTSSAYTKVVQENPLYEDVKSSAIGSMYARHKDAASIIKESVDTIRKNTKVSENTNSEIDQVSAELDNMLSED